MAKQMIYCTAPDGFPSEDCFRLEDMAIPSPENGEVLVETHYLSIDPYMRRQMGSTRNYARPLNIGDVMIGRGCGVVIESRHPDFAVGDGVQAEFGWREYVTLNGDGLRKLPPDLMPLSLSLGVVGQSGATAWVGLKDVAHVQPGETLAVSAAAGAVGSVVGQIGKIIGCRVVGIAGGEAKCRHVVADLGFDHAVDYKAGDISAALAAVAPNGIDVYFDNVGGEVLDAVLGNLRQHARIAICGQISQYSTTEPYRLRNIVKLLDCCARIEGFRISNHLPRRDEALDQLMRWFREGRLKYRETVAEGIEQAPAAFLNMLRGGNYGKQVVRIAAAGKTDRLSSI